MILFIKWESACLPNGRGYKFEDVLGFSSTFSREYYLLRILI